MERVSPIRNFFSNPHTYLNVFHQPIETEEDDQSLKSTRKTSFLGSALLSQAPYSHNSILVTNPDGQASRSRQLNCLANLSQDRDKWADPWPENGQGEFRVWHDLCSTWNYLFFSLLPFPLPLDKCPVCVSQPSIRQQKHLRT